MSHFYGKLKDNGRSSVTTRAGHKKHGMSAQLNGWSIGVDVHLVYDELRGTDIVTCKINLGTNGGPVNTGRVMRAYRDTTKDGVGLVVECE